MLTRPLRQPLAVAAATAGVASLVATASAGVLAGGCVIERMASPMQTTAMPLGETIDAGVPVTIVAVHPEDAYKPLEKQLREQACVTSDLLTRQPTPDGAFYAGGLQCNATGYYFYKVQLARREGLPAATPAAVPVAASDAWPTRVPKVDPAWKESTATIKAPAIVQILAIHAQDAYKSDEATHVGKLCRVVDELTNRGDGFFSGAVTCNDGEDPYYYKAQVRVLSR